MNFLLANMIPSTFFGRIGGTNFALLCSVVDDIKTDPVQHDVEVFLDMETKITVS